MFLLIRKILSEVLDWVLITTVSSAANQSWARRGSEAEEACKRNTVGKTELETESKHCFEMI